MLQCHPMRGSAPGGADKPSDKHTKIDASQDVIDLIGIRLDVEKNIFRRSLAEFG